MHLHKFYLVIFESLEWQSPVPGVRFKAFRRDGKQLRLAEFTPEFVESEWCEKSHIGFVLSGELEIAFHGSIVRYPVGSAIMIPAGPASGHKAHAITPMVRLFLVEDIG